MFSDNSISSLSQELVSAIEACASRHSFSAGSVIMEPGQPVQGVFLLVKGTVKLFRVMDSGERHLLYLLSAKCLCALSSLTGLLGEANTVLAEAETDGEFLIVPQDKAIEWFVEHEEWRRLLLVNFFDGWKESMDMLDTVAFRPLQRRLEKYLAEHAKLSRRKIVHKSHADIAGELNVSREAVSRVLKQMENQDDIHLGHGSIKVIHAKP